MIARILRLHELADVKISCIDRRDSNLELIKVSDYGLDLNMISVRMHPSCKSLSV